MAIGFYFDEFEEAYYRKYNFEAIDFMRKIVYCKDCIYYIEKERLCFHPKQEYGWNSEGGECLQMEPNDFCSYGEKKE